MAAYRSETKAVRQPDNSYLQPTYPLYKKMSARCMSLMACARLRHCSQTTITKWAEYGFYYIGHGDILRCYHCGKEANFMADADPLLEHVMVSSNCCYLEESVYPSRLERYRAICMTFHVQNKVEQTHNSPQTCSAKLPISQKNLESVDKDPIADLPANEPALYLEDPEFQVDNMDELVRENQILRRKFLCHLCNMKDINIMFLPCAHFIYCRDCCFRLSICPLCGKMIQEKVNIYRK